MDKYIGKWYLQRVCGNVIIVKVTGFEQAGDRYESDSLTGRKTIITQSGESFCEDWACCAKAFEANLRTKTYKRFKFKE